MTMLAEIATYLQAEGVGTSGTTIFASQMPDTPDTAVVLHEMPGGVAAEGFGAVLPACEVMRIQVVARAADYATARAKIDAAYRALFKVMDATLSGTAYPRIRPLQSPHDFGRDERRRALLGFNAEVWRVPA